jgi:hypothetical protein
MKKSKLLYVAGVLLVLSVAAMLVNTAASKQGKVNEGQAGIDEQSGGAIVDPPPAALIIPRQEFVYSAKFVCGSPPVPVPNPGGLIPMGPVVPADYRTAINIHNPQNIPVNFTKKVVLALSEFEKPRPPSEKIPFGLNPDYAFEIDCQDIYKIGQFGNMPFAKGFVVITTPLELDMVGVYTSISSTNDITLDVETITPKLIRTIRPIPTPLPTPTPTPLPTPTPCPSGQICATPPPTG